jgi:hypothetical protein
VSTPIEELLRRELRDLATEGRPHNLAGPALREAGRIRLRRASAVVVAVVAVVAAGATWNAAGAGRDRSHPPAVENPSPSPSASPTSSWPGPGAGPARPAGPDEPVSADPGLPLDQRPAGALPYAPTPGWFLYGAPTATGTIVYDRWAKVYREIPAKRGIPAPSGWYVAYFGDDGIPAVYNVTLDRAQRIYAAPPRVPQANLLDWSGGGSQFVYVGEGKPGPVLVEVNVGSGEVRTVPLRDDCPKYCDAFYFNGALVTVPTAGGGPHIYDLDSKELVGGSGSGGGTDGAHSAGEDGREILLTPDGRTVVTRKGGAGVDPSPCPQPLAYWVDPNHILCAGPGAFTQFAVGGEQVSRVAWLPPMQGADPYAVTLYRG